MSEKNFHSCECSTKPDTNEIKKSKDNWYLSYMGKKTKGIEGEKRKKFSCSILLFRSFKCRAINDELCQNQYNH